MIKLSSGSISSFQWSASEQVWPFEKDINGNTLYCKELYKATGPNGDTATLPHGLSPFFPSRIKRLNIRLYQSAGNQFLTFPDGAWTGNVPSYDCTHNMDATNLYLVSTRNYSSYSIRAELTYSKA